MPTYKDAEGYERRIHQFQWVTNIDPLSVPSPGYAADTGDGLIREQEVMRNAISRNVTKIICA